MARIIKLLAVAALIVGAVGAVSFAGAFMKMKSYLGHDLPALGDRHASFVPKAEELDGNPMVWKFSYPRTDMQGLQSITIYVSPTGAVVATVPPNLKARLEPYRQPLP